VEKAGDWTCKRCRSTAFPTVEGRTYLRWDGWAEGWRRPMRVPPGSLFVDPEREESVGGELFVVSGTEGPG
jgi:hypothetical protein